MGVRGFIFGKLIEPDPRCEQQVGKNALSLRIDVFLYHQSMLFYDSKQHRNFINVNKNVEILD